MRQNQPVPMTLAIDGMPEAMPVIGFSGHEALNQPYRFDIDLLGDNPLLDFDQLLSRSAWLSLGNGEHGVHGQICSVSQGYAGTDLSHYRVSLMPGLQRLEQRRQRRILHNLSVPQLLVRLLEEHGLDDSAYRFEPLTGLYPPRTSCVQYDESDLHLLQRLCEEEGIHFRFEHSRRQHLLIFSDDSGSFPQLAQPVRFQPPSCGPRSPAPGLSHLGERLWALPGQSRPWRLHDEHAEPGPTGPPIQGEANQALPHPAYDNRADPAQIRQRQASARNLERLRSERYQVEGRSDQAQLISGHILQVLDHPTAQLNDQWLLSEVRHSSWQPQVLQGADEYDSARILAATMPEANDPGYANGFTAIPWAMPFRPALRHAKPQIHGCLPATLLASADGQLSGDAQGRLPIRFDWQAGDAPDLANASMAHVADSGLLRAGVGAAVWVSHFDNDPDRPLICGLRRPGMRIEIDGIELTPPTSAVHLQRGQRLLLQADSLQLSGRDSRAELTGDSIVLQATGSTERSSGSHDLRLTEQPGPSGRPLPRRNWYIVRMPRPDLSQLARLDPRHLLFEGTTDEQGYLGLSATQQRQLATEYRKTPQQLCLIHPGHCLPLEQYVQQNCSGHQLLLFKGP